MNQPDKIDKPLQTNETSGNLLQPQCLTENNNNTDNNNHANTDVNQNNNLNTEDNNNQFEKKANKQNVVFSTMPNVNAIPNASNTSLSRNKTAASFFPNKKKLAYKNYFYIDPPKRKNPFVESKKLNRFDNSIDIDTFRKTFMKTSKLKKKIPIMNVSTGGSKYIGFTSSHPPKIEKQIMNTEESSNNHRSGGCGTGAVSGVAQTEPNISNEKEMKKYPSSASVGLRRLINTVKIGRKMKEDSANLTQSNLITICNEDIKKYEKLINEQTNPKKLAEHSLPSLKNIIDQPKIKASYISGNLKIMGENYNPFNFNSEKMRSAIKRNVFGSLYQH